MMFGVVKRLLLGRPVRSDRLGHTLLPKRIALPVFASDALSSVAYATEEILIVQPDGRLKKIHRRAYKILRPSGKEHGKQVSLPEWGLNSSGINGGGGDDAYFMTQITNWIKANATAPAIFWNRNGRTLELDIPGYTNGNTPNATAVFKTAFANGV